MKSVKIDINAEAAKMDDALASLKKGIKTAELTKNERLGVVEELDNCIKMLEELKAQIKS